MFRRVFALLGPILLLASSVALADPGVDPATVSASLDPGASLTVTKTVHTPTIPPRPDVLFLADTTGSMGPSITNVRTNAATIMSTVAAAPGVGDARFGAAEYKDGDPNFCPTDPFAYRLDQAITANTAGVLTGMNMWVTGFDGCVNLPESQINALYTLATSGATGFRPLGTSTRIVAWFGDSSGHDPSLGHTEADATAALVAAKIRVIAVNVISGFGDGLDLTGQATRIANATGGTFLTAASAADVSNAILSGLQNLPVVVTHSVGPCDPNLTVTLSPTSMTVTSGTDATFTETITVAAGAPQGTTLVCTVQFLIDGNVVEGFTESITIGVNDVTAPRATCEPTTNPSGANIPAAGTNPKSGQNPDGFYVLGATDNVDPSAQLFVTDSASSFVAGPYASGTRIKLIQAPGATPNVKPGHGAIDWIITLNGDAIVTAVDASGNVSAPSSCKVPPPPK